MDTFMGKAIDWEKFGKEKIPYLKDIVYVRQYPYVGEDGIYVPCQEYAPEGCSLHNLLISKEIFVEAYNKWIKGEENDCK